MREQHTDRQTDRRNFNITNDYQPEMNAAVFENWVEKQLLPNLLQDSCIIMDNASYHSRCNSETKPSTKKG